MTEMIVQTIGALAFVLLLIAAAAIAYRRRSRGSRIIELLSYQSIGQKMGIAAVKIGAEVLILGVTPSDFRLLRKLDDIPGEPSSQAETGEGLSPQKTGRERTAAGLEATVERLRRIKEAIHG